MRRIAVGLGIAVCSVGAGAITGSDFLAINKKDELQALLYVRGVVEGMAAMNAFHRPIEEPFLRIGAACVPSAVTYGQHVAVALKGMQQDPKNLHLPAALLIYLSIRDAWPCAAQSPSSAPR